MLILNPIPFLFPVTSMIRGRLIKIKQEHLAGGNLMNMKYKQHTYNRTQLKAPLHFDFRHIQNVTDDDTDFKTQKGVGLNSVAIQDAHLERFLRYRNRHLYPSSFLQFSSLHLNHDIFGFFFLCIMYWSFYEKVFILKLDNSILSEIEQTILFSLTFYFYK